MIHLLLLLIIFCVLPVSISNLNSPTIFHTTSSTCHTFALSAANETSYARSCSRFIISRASRSSCQWQTAHNMLKASIYFDHRRYLVTSMELNWGVRTPISSQVNTNSGKNAVIDSNAPVALTHNGNMNKMTAIYQTFTNASLERKVHRIGHGEHFNLKLDMDGSPSPALSHPCAIPAQLPPPLSPHAAALGTRPPHESVVSWAHLTSHWLQQTMASLDIMICLHWLTSLQASSKVCSSSF